MSYHLVIERPKHAPHLLASFQSREEAERDRARVLADNPGWETFVRIVPERTYVFRVESDDDGRESTVNVEAGNEQAARLKVLNASAGPVLILELLRIVEPVTRGLVG